MIIKNNFAKGITNSDIAWRYLPNGTMVDAENFFVTITGGSDVGLGKNPTGNILVAANNFLGGKSWGAGKSSSNNKVYYFVKATDYDYLMEYDSVTNANVIVLQSTTGTRLNLIERITNIDIFIDPEGNGNLIAWSGDSNPPRIGNIERMKTWGLDGFTAQEIMLSKAPPTYCPNLLLKISTENTQANYLENKYISFCTRYKYKDGYYSAISSWSKYFFTPKLFNLDFETFENLGMLNYYNAVDLSFNTGGREIVGVDVLFKYSNDTTIYQVDKFIKVDEGWGNNETKTIEFNNSKVYTYLSKDQYFRSFDNIPERVVAQGQIGNRIGFGNYIEGKKLIDKNGNKVVMDYTVELVSNNITQKNLGVEQSNILYTLETPNVNLVNGKISIDLSGVDFNKGNSLVISFRIKNYNFPVQVPARALYFKSDFVFILTDNYVDLSDLLANSTINTQISTAFQSYFEANGGVLFPLNNIPPYIVSQSFLLSNIGNTLNILFPIIRYEIDVVPDPNTYLYDYFYDNNSVAVYNNIATATSLKSYNSYEFCQIYRDEQVRKTTALTSQKNTLFIPNANGITQNQAKIVIPLSQKPPFWAKTYKFGIKRNKGDWEIIPINIFFVDGIFRWIKIDGENLNKLHKGDILIIKRDANGFLPNPIKVKVLELEVKESNFLTNNATTIVEPQGLYAKIKASNFEMQYSLGEFQRYYDENWTTNGRPLAFIGDFTEKNPLGEKIDKVFTQGSTISFGFNSFYHNEAPFVRFDKLYTAQRTYDNFEDFFNEQILPDGFISTSYPDTDTYEIVLTRGTPNYHPIATTKIISITPNINGFLYLIVKGTEAGAGSRNGYIQATVDTRKISGLYIFENTALEIVNETFFETPEIYNIVNGEHEFIYHILTDTYNCFCQGNGIESYQIRDAYNEKKLSIDFCPTDVSEDEYGEVNRYADITYSGIYNSTTNVNRLNEFNLSLANFKDDIEKSYGAIIKIRGKDTDLEVYQEDRVSIVYYGKNLLQNTDGTTNLIQVEEVLNQQNTYDGENGISIHSESFDFESINEYFTDFKRGAVCKKSNNGIFEISNQGQKNYFRKLFRDNKINNIIGAYDLFHDYYYLNIKYNDTEYVTWVYSDTDDGWLGKIKFNPEDMLRINNDFISFKDGNVYKHNQEKNGLLDNYNTFYSVQFPSKFSFVVNDEPSMQKIHKAISMESTDAWDIILETNLNNGFIKKEDFEKQEGVFYGYIRNQNLTIDTALIGANSGIGNCTVNGLNLDFGFVLEDNISIGDEVRNLNLQLVGTILNKTNNSLSLNTVNNVVTGDFVLCSKPQSIEGNNLVGHSMLVTCTIDTNKKTEVFAIGTEVVPSSPT